MYSLAGAPTPAFLELPLNSFLSGFSSGMSSALSSSSPDMTMAKTTTAAGTP